MTYIKKLKQRRFFITDIGDCQFISNLKDLIKVERYAVWAPKKDGQGHKIIDMGNNIEHLKSKYNIDTIKTTYFSQ